MKAAFLVYLDLCEGKQWWNIDLHPCPDLDLVFISGHANRHSPRELVLPHPRGCSISPSILQDYLHKIQLEDYHTSGLTMAIKDTDSTTVYYKVTDGLVPPASPETTEIKKLNHIGLMNKNRLDVVASVDKYVQRKRKIDSTNNQDEDKKDLSRNNPD